MEHRRDKMEKFAVLVPWVETKDGEALLLEVRSEHVRQPGEVCFPGGRAEPGETAPETAVRESCEELGIRREDIDVTGELAQQTMSSGKIVIPVTAKLSTGDLSELKISECEVSEVFLLPLNWLREHEFQTFDLSVTPYNEIPPKLLKFVSRYPDFRGRGKTDYIEYEGHAIWGLTARIIKTVAAQRMTLSG